MDLKTIDIKARLKSIFVGDRVICRIFAAWCISAAINLFSGNNFYELSFLQNKSFIYMIIYIVIGFVLLSFISTLLPKFHVDSWFLLSGATICMIKWIIDFKGEETNKLLFCLAAILVYLLFLVYFLKSNNFIFKNRDDNVETVKPVLEKSKGNRIIPLVATIIIGVFMAVAMSLLSCMRYKTFSTPNYDFGIFCNMFYYMKKTGLPLVTCERDRLLSHFAVHISPIYYLLLPFYYIFPSPLTLQIGQAVVLASGIVPVYLICKKFNFSNAITILVSVVYAFCPAIICGTFYDIHENCFLLPLLLWMFYFFEKEKYVPMYIFAVLVLAVKEDAAVYVAIFGLYMFISKKKYIHGAILAVVSVSYFVLALYLLRTFGTGAMIGRFDNLIYNKDDGLFGAVKTALLNPGFLLTQLFSTNDANYDKIIYFFQMLLPLGFIPFFTKKTSRWLLLIPILMNLLTRYPYQYEIGYQYHFGITAFLIYAMLINLCDIKVPIKSILICISVVAACFMYLNMAVPKITHYCKAYNENKETYNRIEEILDDIPKDSSVCISTMFLPHVADRDIVYELHYHENVPDIEYVVVDVRPGYKGANSKFLDEYLKQGYSIYAEHEDLVTILKQN